MNVGIYNGFTSVYLLVLGDVDMQHYHLQHLLLAQIYPLSSKLRLQQRVEV
jgi:hypothetical protein